MGSAAECQLLVMRHAKSDWDAGNGTDFDRPLSRRGLKEARKAGRWLREEGFAPDAMVASPARRAKDTALIVCEELGLERDIVRFDTGLYEAALDDLLRVIERYAPDKKRMLLVGHNPGLDSLVTHLSAGPPGRTPSGKLMTTSAVAVFDYGGGPVRTSAGSARLARLVRPKEIG